MRSGYIKFALGRIVLFVVLCLGGRGRWKPNGSNNQPVLFVELGRYLIAAASFNGSDLVGAVNYCGWIHHPYLFDRAGQISWIIVGFMYKEVDMMKMTLDLPETLIREAMHLTDTKTETALVIHAVEELVRKIKMAKKLWPVSPPSHGVGRKTGIPTQSSWF